MESSIDRIRRGQPLTMDSDAILQTKAFMTVDDLAQTILSLTPEEQESVRQFVEFIRQKGSTPFLAAVDEFIDQHPELLRRLAQ